MPDSFVYVPFPRKLYEDIVRFSDGRIDPARVAQDVVETWMENSVEAHVGHWGERLDEVAEIYAPETFRRWQSEDTAKETRARVESRPLVWKGVTIPAGSEVRMAYGGDHAYAEVKSGKIADKDGSFSPSEWASKVADGTSRNAWRDLWFREPLSKNWLPAHALRSAKGRSN